MAFYRKIINDHAYNNLDEVVSSNNVGCFNCKKTFSAKEIEKYSTASCPECGQETIIGDSSEFPVTQEWFLQELYKSYYQEEIPSPLSPSPSPIPIREKGKLWKSVKTKLTSVFAFKNGVNKE